MEVRIIRVELFRKFDPSAKKQREPAYFIFGHGEETYLAHLIVNAPDFDQILKVVIPVKPRSRICFARSHDWEHPLKSGDLIDVGQVVRELYFETDDLR